MTEIGHRQVLDGLSLRCLGLSRACLGFVVRMSLASSRDLRLVAAQSRLRRRPCRPIGDSFPRLLQTTAVTASVTTNSNSNEIHAPVPRKVLVRADTNGPMFGQPQRTGLCRAALLVAPQVFRQLFARGVAVARFLGQRFQADRFQIQIDRLILVVRSGGLRVAADFMLGLQTQFEQIAETKNAPETWELRVRFRTTGR